MQYGTITQSVRTDLAVKKSQPCLMRTKDFFETADRVTQDACFAYSDSGSFNEETRPEFDVTLQFHCVALEETFPTQRGALMH